MGDVVAGAVRIVGLASRPDLNGKEGIAIRFEAKQQRWQVRVGNKGLALKAQNLEVVHKEPEKRGVNSSHAPAVRAGSLGQENSAGLPQIGEIVSVRKGSNRRTGLVEGHSNDGQELLLRGEPPSTDTWSVEAKKAVVLEAAPEAEIPTEFLFCNVLARDPLAPAPRRFNPASVLEVRVDHQLRMRWRVRFDSDGATRWIRMQDLQPASSMAEASQPAPTRSEPRPTRSQPRSARSASKGGHPAPVAAEESVFEGENASSSSVSSTKASASSTASSRPALPQTAANGKRKAVTVAPSDEEEAEGVTEPLKSRSKKARQTKSAGSSGASGGGSAARANGAAGGTSRWSRSRAQPVDEFERALDALQPAEDAEGEDKASRPQPPAAPARDPRLQGFRIGGQAETAEERGEGWCGPWSTAQALLERRAAARAERMAELGGEAPPPMVPWTPGRDVNQPRAPRATVVPTLQSLVVNLLVEHIDAVSEFGVLSPAQQHCLAEELCRKRKLGSEQLPLFAPADVLLTELIVPDCHLIDEESLLSVLKPQCEPGSILGLLDLGFCGRCFTERAASLVSQCGGLHSIFLTGCFRLSDTAICSLLEARGGHLRALQLSGNSQLSAAAVQSVADNCGELCRLQLEDMVQLTPESLLPIRQLCNLEHLSLRGLSLLSDEVLSEVLLGSGRRLERLTLRGCSLLTDAAIVSAARLCGGLRHLDLSGVELITDLSVETLAEALPCLQHLSLRRCVQLSDAAIEILAQRCKGSLASLSLNNVPAIGDVAMIALRDHCARSLRELDISWCRGITDHALGSLVDAGIAAGQGLNTLTLWGCAQLTALFFNGHSNHSLHVVGRCFA